MDRDTILRCVTLVHEISLLPCASTCSSDSPSARNGPKPSHSIARNQIGQYRVSSGDSLNHPFHLHTNAMLVVGFPGDDDATMALETAGLVKNSVRDTLPVSDAGSLTVRFEVSSVT